MKPVAVRVAISTPGYGYMNSILRIDLSAMEAHSHDSSSYLPDFIGGRGVAAKIAWDEYPTPIEPFDPANPLMIFPGALTGTRSAYNGRTSVCSFSPQAWPYNWFTRSNIGGWVGGNIKRAGYDGIIITGKADQPMRIRIVDNEVTFLLADDLWGTDALETLEKLEEVEGKKSKSLVIGPAGERLSRIATIQTGSSSACGQGGFGAVMGSKNLKAVSILGSGKVTAARPDAIRDLTRQVAKVASPPKWIDIMFGKGPKELNEELAAGGEGKVRLRPCTEGCVTPCYSEFRDMPGSVRGGKLSGDWICVAMGMTGKKGKMDDLPDELIKSAWDFRLDRRSAFEMNVHTNRYGLNQFDIMQGIVPWLITCRKAGLISELNGIAMDWNSPEFWDAFLHAIAYREGVGDALAEGALRAAHILDMGTDVIPRFYPGWGQSTHWDGHSSGNLPFPFWLPSAIQWLADTRDPFNSGHGSLNSLAFAKLAAAAENPGERTKIVAMAREWSRRIYNTEEAADPYSGYAGKAKVGYFHTLRPVIKDCVPVDDLTFPLLVDRSSEDYSVVLHDTDGSAIEGKDVEYTLFRLGTGVEWSREEFELAAARVYTLERALQVRHWGRNRSLDETALPFFEQLESGQNSLLEKRYGLDRKQFKPVLDEFYTLHGWDPESGRPTRETLESLGLNDVYEQMVAGAHAVKSSPS